MLDTSNHAKEATWHTRIDPQQHGLINTPRFSKRYNLEVVTARLKDTGASLLLRPRRTQHRRTLRAPFIAFAPAAAVINGRTKGRLAEPAL